jgi:hypothetical protein
MLDLKLSAAGAAERGMPALFVSLADAAKAARAGVKAALHRTPGGSDAAGF